MFLHFIIINKYLFKMLLCIYKNYHIFEFLLKLINNKRNTLLNINEQVVIIIVKAK